MHRFRQAALKCCQNFTSCHTFHTTLTSAEICVSTCNSRDVHKFRVRDWKFCYVPPLTLSKIVYTRLKSWNRINVSTLIGLTNSLTRKTFLSVLAFWYSWLLGKADSFYFSDWMVLRLRVIELDNETCKWKWGSAVSDNIMTVHKRKSERSVISAYRLSTMLLPSALKFSHCTLLLQLSRRILTSKPIIREK